MSLLVPDYASSSENEETTGTSASTPPHTPSVVSTLASGSASGSASASILRPSASNAVAAATSKLKSVGNQKKKKTKRKPKTTLYLPPEIQRLLEAGTSGNMLEDDSDDDSELLAKHKRAKKATDKRPRPAAADKDSVLSFLPPPKHELAVPDHASASVEAVVEEKQEQAQTQEATGACQPVDAQTAAAWQQYYQEQQQAAAASQGRHVAQGEDDVSRGSSKRRRTRERDIERALENGHFETVAGQIAEVYGPMTNAWQPPIDPLTGVCGSGDQEVKVKASFWKAQAGTTVSTIKPSRLQRQKHQLNQLAFDAKARDFELLNKRSASLKTKRETYAKYGW